MSIYGPVVRRSWRTPVKRVGVYYGAARLMAVKHRQAMRRRGWRPRGGTGAFRVAGIYGRYANGGEKKFFDLDIDDAAIAAGATVAQDSLNKIPQGITETTRIGRKCTLVSIHGRGAVQLSVSTAAANTSDEIRLILFLDKQANGASAATTDILESANIHSFLNLANKGRFRILMDKTFDMVCPSGGGDGTTEDYGEDTQAFQFHKRCHLPIEFSAAAGALSEIRSNNIGLLTLSTAGLCSLNSKWRLRFSDA